MHLTVVALVAEALLTWVLSNTGNKQDDCAGEEQEAIALKVRNKSPVVCTVRSFQDHSR